MEECEAAAVGRKPPPQIVPALDLVHRLIGDQLLQHRGRRLPVDPPQFEKAAVEPRGEQMLEVGVEQLQFRFARAAVRQFHCASRSTRWCPRAPCSYVAAVPAGADRRPAQERPRLPPCVGEIALRRRAQRRSVGLELRGEITLEAVPIAGVESAQRLVQFARDQQRARTPRRVPIAASLRVAWRARETSASHLGRTLEGRLIGLIASPSQRVSDGMARRNFAGGT